MLTAVSDMETAYTAASGQTATITNAGDGAGGIGGMTLGPGVYSWNANIAIDSDITFTGGAGDVFILQTMGSLDQASATRVNLAGGALASNIFRQVAGGVVLGTAAHMVLLVKNLATFATGSSLHGRVFAQTAVTLAQTVITPN
jgi:hypothetical protein